MNQPLLTPKELTEYLLYAGDKRIKKPLLQMFLQGILAGIYIALGAIGYFRLVAHTADPGLGQFLGALVFPLGVIAVLSMQTELFTSNCMMIVVSFKEPNRTFTIFKRLFVVLGANFIGALFIAYLSNVSGIYTTEMMEVISHKAVHKVHMSISQLIFSGILCNILVCTGICMAYSAKDGASKILYAWISIIVFVLSGTEHIVANMYYLLTAYIGGAEMTIAQMGYNFLFVTIGNFIGGGIIVAGMNYLISRKELKEI